MDIILYLFLFLLALSAQTSSALRFAAISGDSDFFLPVEQGWKNTCSQLGVNCTYITPDFSELGDGLTASDVCLNYILQLQQEGLDGLALGNTGCNKERMAPVIAELEASGIPVVLFDRDWPDTNRTAYVGTDNVMMGRTMARLLKQLRPQGGNFVIIATTQGRRGGFIEEITKDNDRDDRAHWYQIDDSTIKSDIPAPPKYIDIMDQYIEKHEVDAFIILRQTPMRYVNWTQHVDSHRDRDITYIGTDGSDYQLSYLHRKYVDGLIGQLPYEFGSASVQTLYDIVVDKKEVPNTVATNLVTYNLIPLELPDLAVDQNLLRDLKYIGWICFGIIALSVIFCSIWTFINREGIVVRASQPFFLFMTACGVFMIGATLIPLSFDDHGNPGAMSDAERVGICMSTPWLAFTGFTITFSALFSKTWRINTLINKSSQFVRAKLEIRDVMGPFLALITCNWVVLVCWTIFDPLKYDRQFLPGTDFWNREFASAGSCDSENPLAYLIPLGLLNLLVLVIACVQAYKARGIETEFSEATYIGLAMFTLCQAYLSGVPIVIVVKDIPVAYYLVLTFLIFLLCMAIILFIFLPKIFLQKKYKQMPTRDQQNLMASKLRQSMAASNPPETGSNLQASNDAKAFRDDDEKFISAELQIKMSENSVLSA